MLALAGYLNVRVEDIAEFKSYVKERKPAELTERLTRIEEKIDRLFMLWEPQNTEEEKKDETD